MFSHIRRVIAELDVHTLASSVATCSACQYDALAQARGTLPIGPAGFQRRIGQQLERRSIG